MQYTHDIFIMLPPLDRYRKGGVHNEPIWFFYCFRCGKYSSLLYLQMAERRQRAVVSLGFKPP